MEVTLTQSHLSHFVGQPESVIAKADSVHYSRMLSANKVADNVALLSRLETNALYAEWLKMCFRIGKMNFMHELVTYWCDALSIENVLDSKVTPTIWRLYSQAPILGRPSTMEIWMEQTLAPEEGKHYSKVEYLKIPSGFLKK